MTAGFDGRGAGARELRARALAVELEGVAVLVDIDAVALAGEVSAVVGPSGAGKTTLLMALAGIVEASRGAVELDGRPLATALGGGCRLGFVPQTLGLVPVLTAAEHVSLPLQATRLGPEAIAQASGAALHAVGLDEAADRLAAQLSGGQRQRLAVARAVAGDPDLLVADEPTAELDADNCDRVVELLRAAASRGAIVVVATHDPAVAERADRVLRLLDGRLAT